MPWRCMGEWMYRSTSFLDLGTGWRWVDSFTSLPLYPRGKSPRYPLVSRLGGPQNRSGRRGDTAQFPRNNTLSCGIIWHISANSILVRSYISCIDHSYYPSEMQEKTLNFKRTPKLEMMTSNLRSRRTNNKVKSATITGQFSKATRAHQHD
jgi:hypothetical protein